MTTGEAEEEKKNFAIDPKIMNAITAELEIEFTLGASKTANEQNFKYLNLLVRAITNAMILDKD